MRISISFNSRNIIEFDQLSVHGREAAGGFGFVYALKGTKRAVENEMAVFDIRLSLALMNSNIAIEPSTPSSSQIIQCNKYQNTNEQLHFEMVFSKEIVNALEEYRQETDLKLCIGLRAMSAAKDGLSTSFDSCDVVIPREQWIQALKKAGFRNTVLFEVPIPYASSEFSKVISKAQEFVETGHYKDAVMQCRLIIEKIEILRGDKSSALAANKKTQNRSDREAINCIERMLALRESIKSICHLGAHESECFTRSQAKAVLAMTLSLLAEPTVGFSDSLLVDQDRNR